MSIDHLLNKTAVSYRAAHQTNSQGGDSETFPESIASLKIRIQIASGRERIISDKEDAIVTHVAYIKPGVDVVRRDHIVESVSSQRYEVLAMLPPSVNHHQKLAMQEIADP